MKRLLLTAALVTFAGLVVAGKLSEVRGGNDKPVLSASDRGIIAKHLTLTFASDVRAQGQDVRAWAIKLGRAVGKAQPANAQRAARMPTLEAAMAVLMGQPVDSSSIRKVVAASNSELISANLIGDPIADLVFTPLPNGRCRVADSREISSPMTAGLTRAIDVEDIGTYGPQGGNGGSGGDGSTNCGIPSFTASLVVSVTVLPTTPTGFFKIFANNQVFSDGNTVFWSNSGGVTNDVIVKSCQSCLNELSVYASAGTHYVVDVLGYFMRPEATALDCVTTAVTTEALPAATNGIATAPACGVGYAEVSAQCRLGFFTDTLVGIENGSCYARAGANASSINVSRRCCRIPGR